MASENTSDRRRRIERDLRLLSDLKDRLTSQTSGSAAQAIPLVETLIAQAKDLLKKQDDFASRVPLVAVVGSFNAGKSSFINSLLGEEICPVDACPTTSSITWFVYASKERIECTEDGGSTREIDRQHYKRLVRHNNDGNGNISAFRFTYYLPSPLLKMVSLVDTPGFENPKNPYDSARTKNAMERADALFYLMDIETGNVTRSALELLERLREQANELAVYLILNKADRKPAAARKRILQENEQKFQKLFRRCLLFAARPSNRAFGLDGVSTHNEIISLLEELRTDRRLLIGGSLRHEERAYLDKRQQIISKVKRYLWRASAEVRNRKKKVEVKSKKIEEKFETIRDEVPGFLDDLIETIANNCLEVEEIPNTGWFWNDARIILNTRDAKEIHDEHEFWSSLDREVRMLGRTFELWDPRVDPSWEEWEDAVQSAKSNSWSRTARTFRAVTQRFGERFDSEGEARSRLEQFLCSAIDEIDSDGIAEPIEALLDYWSRRFEVMLESSSVEIDLWGKTLAEAMDLVESMEKEGWSV
jgi:ribosome biogenesis GTPase A